MAWAIAVTDRSAYSASRAGARRNRRDSSCLRIDAIMDSVQKLAQYCAPPHATTSGGHKVPDISPVFVYSSPFSRLRNLQTSLCVSENERPPLGCGYLTSAECSRLGRAMRLLVPGIAYTGFVARFFPAAEKLYLEGAGGFSPLTEREFECAARKQILREESGPLARRRSLLDCAGPFCERRPHE